MKMRKMKSLVLLLLLVSGGVTAQKAPTLQELIDSALVHDYSRANQQLALEQIELDQQRIQDAFMPRVSFNAKEAYMYGATNFNLPELLILPEYENRYHMDNFLTQAELKADFLILSGGKVSQLKKANAARLEAETALANLSDEEIISAVYTSYDQLALLKEVKLLLDDSEKRLQVNEKQAKRAVELGLITQYDYNKINLSIAQLEAKKQEYEGKRRLLLMNLHTITKIDTERLALIDADLQVMMVNYVNKPVHRNELTALEAAVKANEYKVKAANTWWIPKIGASASVSYMGIHHGNMRSSDPMLFTDKKLDHNFNNYSIAPLAMVGVGLQWDLFDGRTGINETKRAKIDLKMAQNKHADISEKIALQLEKNRIELEIAQSQIANKQAALTIAEDAIKQANKEFELGLIKSVELIDADNDYQVAQMEYAQSVFQQRRAAVEYLKAAGLLTATLTN